eukprot:CAMPEP_0185698944 /NCGR_PEP_ID=MMETSP1164-20130828/6629_1 /TAXON_ID=1104430 /ORGANISM="Chrysoreinhardia sp, Strain CCMP2950" /LENGTH=143 /DNA_ID=CAMNT_0028365873 /DNA_START=16 /DNA_END=444 /DNA_ORIENTATION=+
MMFTLRLLRKGASAAAGGPPWPEKTTTRPHVSLPTRSLTAEARTVAAAVEGSPRRGVRPASTSHPTRHKRLPAELERVPAPVARLLVVANPVVGAHADPLRDLPVLLALLRERALELEVLVRRHGAVRRGGALCVGVWWAGEC